jgi:hypothetical protein
MVYKVIHKATNFKAKPPKEKHIQSTLTFTYDSRNSEEILRSLCVRKDKTNWAVVLKVLIVMHRCFKDGSDEFIKLLSVRPTDIFALNFFKRTAPPNHVITVFISKYSRYLEEKVSVYKTAGIQFEKEKDCLTDFSDLPHTLRLISKLQSQLNALCNCKLRVRVSDLKLIKFAYRLLLKDSFILYAKLNEVMLTLSDLFWEMDKSDAAKVLAIYKLFIKETTALTNMYNNANMMFSNLPKLKEIDSGIISTMEEFVENLGETTNRRERDSSSHDSAEDLADHDTLRTNNQFESGTSGYGEFDEPGSDSAETDTSSGDDNDNDQNDDFLSLIMGGIGVSSGSFFQRPNQKDSSGMSYFSPSTPPPSNSSYQHKANFIRQAFDFNVSSPTTTTITNVTSDPLDLFNLDKLNSSSIQPVHNSKSVNVNANPFDVSVNPFSNRIVNQNQSVDNSKKVVNPFESQTNSNPNPFLGNGGGSGSSQSNPNPFLGNGSGTGSSGGQPNPFLSQGSGGSGGIKQSGGVQVNPFLSQGGGSSSKTKQQTDPFNPFIL